MDLSATAPSENLTCPSRARSRFAAADDSRRRAAYVPPAGKPFDATGTLEKSAHVLFDALALPNAESDLGVLMAAAAGAKHAVAAFIAALGRHRRPECELALASR